MTARVLALLLMFSAGSGACSSSTPSATPAILIGSDLPVSGQPGDLVSLQEAIQLVVDEHSTIHGFRLGYEPFDDAVGRAAWPEKGVQNVKLMIADPRVLGMIGPFNSYVAQDEIPRAAAGGLVMISPTTSDLCLRIAPYCTVAISTAAAEGRSTFFQIAGTDPDQGLAMGRYAGSLGIKRVAVVNEWYGRIQGDGQLIIDQFAHALARSGGEVVIQKDLPSGTHDFGDFVAAARAAGATAIYAVGQTGDADPGICLVRAQMAGFKYLLLTDGATTDTNCLKAGSANSPTTLGTYIIVDPTRIDDSRVQTIVAALQKAYPHSPINDYAYAAYDCALILVQAIERAIVANGGSIPTRLEVLREIQGGQFNDGATGTYSFDARGDAVSPLMSIWGVNQNGWYYMTKADATATP